MVHRSRFLSLVLLAGAVACQQGPGGPGDIETAVFPNEARLGGTVAIAIDSNYIPVVDSSEHYDLDPQGVLAWISDDLGTEIPATVRAVFPLLTAPSSKTAAGSPGRFVTIALIDLPTTGLSVPANQARIRVFAHFPGAPVFVSQGSLRLVGVGGTRWYPPTPGYLALEKGFETRSLLRLRAVRRNPQSGSTAGPADGFLDTWQIGGIEFEVQYPDCLQKPDPFPNSEAVRATALATLASPLPSPRRARVVLVSPAGFTVKRPFDPFGNGSSPGSAGEGPILDLAFDRVSTGATCSLLAPGDFVIRKLFVTDTNGATLIDRREGDDVQTNSTELFTLRVMDADAS